MIDSIFGEVRKTIEVCSGSVKSERGCYTVDVNPKTKPNLVDNGERLASIPDNSFERWRCDPPYSINAARSMYGTRLPNTMKLLKAGARVCKPGALMFLLLGPKNHQWCPKGIKRIGWIALTIVPCNEIRCLNIFLKTRLGNGSLN
jgi:hypothetical protein